MLKELELKQKLIQQLIKFINLMNDPDELVLLGAQNFDVYYIPTVDNGEVLFIESNKESFDKYLKISKKDNDG